ncbi:hypothetical protein XthCFBP4691_17950 [Xanthomonas theicola]|uniref:DUF6538 domain-containing protein n=1 Tax=Xanthomonas theicola TaxID=56464 RepID=A0A2S6ZAW7_9XANT|nr:hypothetical protein XthCFBP4691_17950 [Xanthomonas theicola]
MWAFLFFLTLDPRLDTSMRVAHYLTRGETGRFYVRLRVPADLQARLGRKVIKRSTGTTCDRTALTCALSWSKPT